MKDKNVIIVATTAYMINQFNKPNLELLLQQGYKVFVACNLTSPGPMPENKVIEFIDYLEKNKIEYFDINIPRNPINFKNMISSYMKLRKILKHNNFSIVHSHAPTGGALARLAAAPFRRKGLKSIYTAHGLHFYKGSSALSWVLYYPMEKILSYFTDVLITINLEDYQLVNQKKFKASELKYIPGVGIDLNKINELSTKEKIIKRQELGYWTNDFILIYVAELNDNKNQILLLDAMKELNKYEKNIKLLLVGEGENFNMYTEYINDNQLKDNVKLLGYRDDVFALNSISNLYVASSKREGLPVNILEAILCNLPVIATNSRGHRDIVKFSDGNYILEENTKEQLIKAIKYYYTNYEFIINEKTNNIQILKKFSTDFILNELEEIYR